ncbi:MAG: tetratricopeptide repeat protein [Blastocatellia bacterium]|nr:tetratricopeptide repeat protein [Blastocatellia bacterium]
MPTLRYVLGPFQIDSVRRTLWRGGKIVSLSPKAFEMLLLLIECEGRLLEKQELMDRLWPGSIVEEANLSQTVYLLRRALGEGGDEALYIETIPKRGYRLTGSVQLVEETAEGVDPSPVGEKEGDGREAPAVVTSRSHRLRRRWGATGLGLAGLFLLFFVGRQFWLSQGASQSAMIRSVAVLPFKPLDFKGEDRYLGLAMADALITRLIGINQIVIQPTSAVRKYDDPEADPLMAGRQLRVDAVLEGTLQKTTDRMRLTLRLYDVRDGRMLWSGKFDEKFTDIFAVQDAITDQVAAALALNLTREKRELMFRRYTDNAAAYELYMKGRYWWNKRTIAGVKKAMTYFEQAAALSSDYALAYAGLADCYYQLSIFEAMSPREAFPRARASAEKALKIDDTLVEARVSLGWVKWVHDWDWEGAEREFRRAIELSPSYAPAHDMYGVCLAQQGRFDPALEQLKLALQLDPLSLVARVHIGWTYFYAEQYDRAIEQYQQALEMEPGFTWARVHLSQAYEQKGMYAESIAELNRVMSASSASHRHQAALAHVYSVSGRRREAFTMLEELLQREKKEYVSPYSIALVYAGLEERAQALDWLRKGMEQHAGRMVRLRFDARFKNLRSEPQFVELVQQFHPAGEAAMTSSRYWP